MRRAPSRAARDRVAPRRFTPRRVARAGVAVALGGVLALGLSACDGLPIELPTDTGDINLPELPTSIPIPPVVTETVTADPEPQPTVTVTVTADPLPQPTVTETMKVTPAPVPQPTVTVTADAGAPQPQPTVTVTATPEPTQEPSPSPSPTPSASPSATPTPTASATPEEPAPAQAMPWWPWLAGGIVLASLLAWWGISASNRSAARRRLETARYQVNWFESTLTPHVLSQASAADAVTAWQDGRPVVLDIDRELYAQSTQAPTLVLRKAAADGRIALAELIAALDAGTAADADADADALRALHARIDAARAKVRAWVAAQVR